MAVSTDVLIIGAGVIGCALARELARAGMDVIVLEAAPEAAAEASRAAVGILNYAPPTARPPRWHALGRQCLAAHHKLEQELSRESALAPEWQWCGLIRVAEAPKYERRLRRESELNASNNFATEWLDAEQLHALAPELARDFYCGCRHPLSGRVDPRRLTLALADAARTAGACFLFNRPAEPPHPVRRRIETVRAGGETFTPGQVVNAAGAWSTRLFPHTMFEVFPVRGQALRLATDGPPLITQLIIGAGVYLAPDGDGVIVGATREDAGFDKVNTAGGIDKLLRGALRLAPCLGRCDWQRSEVCSGLRPTTRDKVPLIGPDPVIENLWWATGHYTHGVLFAPLTARLIRQGIDEHYRGELFTTELFFQQAAKSRGQGFC